MKTTEELDTPILVLTYKNHALDEFLKHTMKFCEKSDIIRIGGRSKEATLDECNLKEVTRNTKSNRMCLSEIYSKKEELLESYGYFENACDIVVKEASVTPFECLSQLDENQLTNLVKFPNNKFKLLNGKVAQSKKIDDLINIVCYLHGSLKDFIHFLLGEHQDSDLRSEEKELENLFEKAIVNWLPSKSKHCFINFTILCSILHEILFLGDVSNFAKFYNKAHYLFEMPKSQDHSQMKDDNEDVEEVDQDTIQEIIASRYVDDKCWYIVLM